jgi:tetratricopeptide (TPR) repeat protein
LLKWAQQCVTRALSINPSSSAAQFAQGLVFHQSGSPEGAIRHFREAADLDPNDADATAMLAFQLTAGGVDLDRAGRLAERAAALDPLNPMNKGAMGWIHAFNCDFSAALKGWRDWQQVLEQAKSTFRLWLAWLYATNGNLEEAFRIIEQMAQDSPGHPMADGGSFLKHALLGDRERTLGAVTEQLEQAAWWDDAYSLFMADGYALVGELDRAFPWLDHSIDYGWCNPYFLEHEPLIENLRSDVRFKASLERAKRLSESLLD